MKKVLIPTAFNNNTLDAVRYVVDLFDGDICSFKFLHLVDLPSSITELLMISRNNEEDQVPEEFKQQVRDLLRSIPNVYDPCEVDFFYGKNTTTLSNYLENQSFDLIVLPSKGEFSVMDYSIKKLFMKINYPVLQVPKLMCTERAWCITFWCT